MSGGDGRDHNTGAHNTSGNINGGPTGLGVGGGASDGSGWSSENNPWGGSSGSGIHWGGGSGRGNGGGNGNSGGTTETGGNLSAVAAPVAFGFPTLANPGGGLAVSISASKLSKAITDIISTLKKVKLNFTPAGFILYTVWPSEIAKDDPNLMSKIVTSLPADDITESPVSSLPLDKATVNVNIRVVDDVKNERQNISVVSGVPMSVPVIDAKPTNRHGVFTASIPGAPVLNISVNNSTPAVQTLSPGITNNSDKVNRTGFTLGGNTMDAVIRFPKDSGHNAVYVSVSDVLSPGQVRQRQDEENRRQQEWNATHPVEVAEREYENARAELEAENKNVHSHQVALDGLKNTAEGLALSDAGRHPLTSSESRFVAVPGYSGGGVHFDATATVDSRDRLNSLLSLGGAAYVNNVLELGEVSAPTEDGLKVGNAIKNAIIEVYDKLRQRLITRQNEINHAQVSLNTAIESRNKKEEKKRSAENKLNEERNKPRKGTKDYGHDYHPAPKTEDIKGLGELKEGRPKTPKQGGGGKRARWYGDKGRKIYEWDSQHGELEGYRASDGQHLGSFDPKTGKQLKGPDPKRNIKKYL
ncbi:TPA: S-type pyocin domain-containing protein [Escherichia coli]|nr:S-type pyocin domain-containing protein [Escherichia coli]